MTNVMKLAFAKLLCVVALLGTPMLASAEQSGNAYFDRGIDIIEAYFEREPQRELFGYQTILSNWHSDQPLSLDGKWGPQTERAFSRVFETYTAIGGDGPDWGVNALSDVPRFLEWVEQAAFALSSPDGVEFPD